MQTYLFYDIESTGLNKSFDQVLHFAAIRTDLKFKELARYDIKVKLNPDVIPAPQAMLTHHMRLQDIAQGMCEYDAIKQIHELMNTPGTISLGYNTLSFDDEFLRFSFYRNLLPPYTHQFANQCSRMDIYPMTIMYYLFKNSALKWPVVDGRVSLKLENLNAENNFVAGRAHDAMVDVEATLKLAKKLAESEDMWEYVAGYFNKKTDQERLQKLQADQALMVLGKFGSTNQFQSVALSLGPHYHYTNQSLWLQLDNKDFATLPKETLLESVYVSSKKLGEPGFLLPLKDRFIQYITPERNALIAKNKQWLQENPDLFNLITEHYRSYRYPEVPGTDIDASLYLNGFWTPPEESFCKKFTVSDIKTKALLCDTTNNAKLRALTLRILGRNFPEVLTKKQQQEFADYMQRINPLDPADTIIDFKNQKRLTPAVALQEIAALRETHKGDAVKTELLVELEKEIRKKI